MHLQPTMLCPVLIMLFSPMAAIEAQRDGVDGRLTAVDRDRVVERLRRSRSDLPPTEEGLAGRLGTVMTTVVVDGQKGKEYRLPTELEVERAAEAENVMEEVFDEG